MSDQICYSAKYYDDDHEYRYVCLKRDALSASPERAWGANVHFQNPKPIVFFLGQISERQPDCIAAFFRAHH